jgi:hypothetical protein
MSENPNATSGGASSVNRTLVLCAVIISAAILGGAAMQIYSSPFQTCVRLVTGRRLYDVAEANVNQARVYCSAPDHPN